MNIDELDLSVRAYNCLKRAGINTTDDICILTQDELMKVRNLGRKCTEEVIKTMKQIGLRLKDDVKDTKPMSDIERAIAWGREYIEYATWTQDYHGDNMKLLVNASEKQIPKKPTLEGDGYADGHLVYDTWICPCCEKHYEVDYDDYEYCPNCGQAIDRSGEDE